MQNIYQKTVANPATFIGVGLHSGLKTKVTVLPAKENHGIIFKRIDLKQDNLVAANFKNVSSARLCTTLKNSHGIKVSTVEHLLAAMYILGIDNALIEINCEEVPIMDGSAKNFLDILKKSKTKTLLEKRKFLKILDKVQLIDGKRSISIEPGDDSLEVQFQLDYNNQIIGKQKNTINFDKDDIQDVYESRTFCLYQDIEKIKKAGLAKGGSLDNAVVVDENKVLNEGGLRNQKEFVNHKILDLAGDFLLSGYNILGKVGCHQGGHELSNMFLKKLLVSKNFYKITQAKEDENLFKNKDNLRLNNLQKLAVNA